MITVYNDAPEQKKLEGIIIVVNAYRLRYIASFSAYAPPNSKLCLRAVGELAAYIDLRRDFHEGEYSHACRLQASLTRSAQRMRTRILLRKTSSSRNTTTKKAQTTARAVCVFWSKWRDSNSRPPVPEQIHHRFLTTFVDFLVLFSPKTMLSDALVRTVST